MTRIGTSPARLAWLAAEVDDWREEGLLTDASARAILGRYVAVRRFSIVRLISALGAAFIVAGLVWLVASNLDRLGPAGRVALVGTIWLVITGFAEWLARRRALAGDAHSPLVGAVRLVAAGALGAVVYLVGDLAGAVDGDVVWWLGVWGVGALAYGYLRDSVPPVLLGAGLVVLWYAVQSAMAADSMFAFTGAALAAAVIATAVAVLHPARWASRHGFVWTSVGVAATLIGTFAAGIPFERGVDRGWPWLVVLGIFVAAVLGGVAAQRVPEHRLDVIVAVGALALGLLLSTWETDDTYYDGSVEPMAWVRAIVSVAVFLAVASGVMVLGVRRDNPVLTAMAAVGLVVFVTFQAFAVFAPILSGAALFLTVGVILVGTGFLVDRGRRHLVAELADDHVVTRVDA